MILKYTNVKLTDAVTKVLVQELHDPPSRPPVSSMGTVDQESLDNNWRENRIFTGTDPCYPIELFIALIEGEAELFHHDQARIASNAWHLISGPDNTSSPASLWKEKFKHKYAQDIMWDCLRGDLLDAFGRQSPYSVAENVLFLKSLFKGQAESHQTFLLRVRWVLKTLGDECAVDKWAKLLFLMGIEEDNLEFPDDKNVEGICETLMSSEISQQDVKDEENVSEIESDEDLPIISKQVKKKAKKEKTWSENDTKKDHYYCGMCKFSCELKNEWDDHEKLNHLGKCHICDLPISDLQIMRTHHKKDHQNSQAKCPTCNMAIRYWQYGDHKCKAKSTDERRLKGIASQELRRGLRLYILKEGESHKEVKPMTSHITGVVDGTTKWYCGFCHQDFQKPKELRVHTHTAHDGKKFRCDICLDFRGKMLESIAEHKLLIHGVITDTFELLKCTMCDFKTLKSESAMTFHVKACHSNDRADSTCQICGKRFQNSYSCRAHVEGVHMKMRFKCDKCTKKFSSDSQLRKHEAVCSGPEDPEAKSAKTVICTTCGKKYTNQFALAVHHKRMHEEVHEKQVCKVCGKVMKDLVVLKQHIKKQHGVKQLSCPQCQKTFSLAYELKVHFNAVHKNIKRFSCKLCSNSWMTVKDCAMHIAMNHENWSREEAQTKYRAIVDAPHPAFVKNSMQDIEY